MTRVGEPAWLEQELHRLLGFGTGATAGDWLDERGAPDPTRPLASWIAARMVHVRSLATLLGVPGSDQLAEAGVRVLAEELHDREHGGWVSEAGTSGPKECYAHAFVVLAAETATRAGVAGAAGLRDEALTVFEDRFWDDDAGRCVDSWDATWDAPSSYRGLNSTMHAVEAMLAVGGPWRARAARVADWLVELGRAHDWRLPEHFDGDWRPQLDHNIDRPDDRFQPYGATVGHGLEWARLLLAVDADRYLPAAVALYDRALADGWHVNGAPGFVYTTDWEGRPVIRDRMHWVVAEAIAAAAVLGHHTGDARYTDDQRRFWEYADAYLLDRELGSWHHQLDVSNRPIATVWPGKPDLYHAVQATLVPRSPGAVSVVDGVLDLLA